MRHTRVCTGLAAPPSSSCSSWRMDLVFCLLSAAVVYFSVVLWRIRRALYPSSRPHAFYQSLRRHGPDAISVKRVVICVGDSLTHGAISFDWTAVLQERHPEIAVFNAGVTSAPMVVVKDQIQELLDALQHSGAGKRGDLRVDLVVLAGTNDVLASLSDTFAKFYMHRFRLVEKPSLGRLPGVITDTLDMIEKFRCRKVTVSLGTVAVVSIPPMGERLGKTPHEMHVREVNNFLAQECSYRNSCKYPRPARTHRWLFPSTAGALEEERDSAEFLDTTAGSGVEPTNTAAGSTDSADTNDEDLRRDPSWYSPTQQDSQAFVFVDFYTALRQVLCSRMRLRLNYPPAADFKIDEFFFFSAKKVLLHFLVFLSWDALARYAGLLVTTDHVHLNSRSGLMLCALVEQALFPLSLT